jgi:ubiquinone/menaquinone biosynthesis C-methylase UbiE
MPTLAQADACHLPFGNGSFDWACSSHLVEHFLQPQLHIADVARVLSSRGTAFFVTPNEPADFENPYHVHLFTADTLADALGRCFGQVEVAGIDAAAHVKQDFIRRRSRASKVLALDVLRVRHRVPRTWYIAVYSRLLPWAYRLLTPARGHAGETITADDFVVTPDVDDTTLALFGVARDPRQASES